MQIRSGRLTDTKARELPAPAAGYAIHWCPTTPGFGVRVTANGARAWIAERRVDGKTKRVTLGRADGRNAITAEAARKLVVTISSELQQGIDRAAIRRERQRAEAQEDADDRLTLAVALREYVAKKRRIKDGLPLKDRTRADYLAMIEPGGTSADGKPFADGALYTLADRPLKSLTGDEIRRWFKAIESRGKRQQTYAAQVLRAVLNWQGVTVPGNPLGKDVAGKDRLALAKPVGDPNPIPPEKLGTWWRAANDRIGSVSADFYSFMLLTGARSGETKAATVADFDADGARLTLRDTKNRRDHVLMLSTQAAAIVAAHATGKKPDAPIFSIADGRKVLQAINAAAGVNVTPHDLRASFASVAEELVSAYALKRMLNHSDASDVTGGHYVGKSEAQLRAAWQIVADFIVSSK